MALDDDDDDDDSFEIIVSSSPVYKQYVYLHVLMIESTNKDLFSRRRRRLQRPIALE